MVIQVLTITQRFGHGDTVYFHIPDGCYFNYTELLDIVLWIYLFFYSSAEARSGSGKVFLFALILFDTEPCFVSGKANVKLGSVFHSIISIF